MDQLVLVELSEFKEQFEFKLLDSVVGLGVVAIDLHLNGFVEREVLLLQNDAQLSRPSLSAEKPVFNRRKQIDHFGHGRHLFEVLDENDYFLVAETSDSFLVYRVV
jgi:hypothetical protein